MMQLELTQPSRQSFHTLQAPIHYSSSCMSAEDFSDVSISVNPLSSPTCAFDDASLNFSMDRYFQCLQDDSFLVDEIEGVSQWLVSESCRLSASSQLCPEDLSASAFNEAFMAVILNHPEPSMLLGDGDHMVVDSETSITHLLKGYGEAMEMEQTELTREILRRLREKACPTGTTLERVAYYLIRGLDEHADILRQEASKNYEAAFSAFYQIFPYGRFAHFTANSVILQSMPEDAEIVHVVDFDIGNGIQWPPLIEALANRGHKEIRLTSIKWDEDDDSGCTPSCQRLEEMRTRLHEHASTFGLRLKMEEMDMEGVVSEMKKTKRMGEWLAFNCMVGLPHMGEGKSVKHVIEFLRLAKESINMNCYGANIDNNSHRGVIVFGDGVGWGKGMRDCNGYGSIFEGQLVQFHALLESIDDHFPQHLREAKIAMECLFLTPYISSISNFEMWKDIIRESRTLAEVGLEAWGLMKDDITEAKELVGEGKSLYWVCIEGAKENQIVMGYKGTPLVKVSSWT